MAQLKRKMRNTRVKMSKTQESLGSSCTTWLTAQFNSCSATSACSNNLHSRIHSSVERLDTKARDTHGTWNNNSAAPRVLKSQTQDRFAWVKKRWHARYINVSRKVFTVTPAACFVAHLSQSTKQSDMPMPNLISFNNFCLLFCDTSFLVGNQNLDVTFKCKSKQPDS